MICKGKGVFLTEKTEDAIEMRIDARILEIRAEIAVHLVELGTPDEITAWKATRRIKYDGGQELVHRLILEGTTDEELNPILKSLYELRECIPPKPQTKTGQCSKRKG